ncbi:MAG: hypothetical protein WCP03_00030 [Candidatus Saccharibacteria bacterium]
MRYLRESSEQEMVAEFLKGEFKSPRYATKIKALAHQLNIPVEIIHNPNLEDTTQNNQRAQILTKYRGYGDKRGVFSIVPDNTKWQLQELNKIDILSLYHIGLPYWHKLSQLTNKVKVSVETVMEDEEVQGQSNQQFYKIATDIEQGAKLPPVILVKNEKIGHSVIIEGNVRAVAIGIARVNDFKIKAIIGME